MPCAAQNGISSESTKQSVPVTAPVMPTPPSMPTLSVPSMSAPRYTPDRNTAVQRQTNTSQNGSRNSAQNGSAANDGAQNSAQTGGVGNTMSSVRQGQMERKTVDTPVPAANEMQVQMMRQLPAGKTQSGNSSDANRSKNESAVSAADLTSLAKKGLLNNFYSLLGASGNGALLPGGISAGAPSPGGMTQSHELPSSSNAMLERILSELTEVKKQNAEAVKSEEAEPLAHSAHPGILRFIVNGCDVLASCRAVYFSDIGTDGMFLLTGDRAYTASGQKRTETFYLLFRPAGVSGFSTQYKVEGSVVQDYTNEHSFMYRLAALGDLSAMKTGNLVSMRTSDPNCRADLLIDIGSEK